jgi:hypothetical protein
MGLHLDVQAIHEANSKLEGFRKYVGVLINQEGKLSKSERERLQIENQKIYGLPKSFYSKIKLPRPTDIKVFELKDIVDCKRNITTAERIHMLREIQDYSFKKLENIKTSQKETQDKKVY